MSKLIPVLVLYCAILVFTDGLECPLHDIFLSRPGNAIIYTRLFNGALATKSIECPAHTIFSTTEFKCVKSEVKCTRSGRIVNTSSSNCTTYLICTQLEDGSYASKSVSCPTGTLFSPNVSRCVSANDYKCPEIQPNDCQGNGRFSNSNSLNCSSYLICTQMKDGSYTSNQVNCPTGTLFSSSASRCVSLNNFTCPRLINETETNFQENGCKSNGRFSDPFSTNCSSYLICTRLEDGNYSFKNVNCPSGTLFSSKVSRCVSTSTYICPSTKNETHENIQFNGCLANGRFSDPNSMNCTSYQICTQLTDGNYSAQLVTCPVGTVFSPNGSRCVSNSSFYCPRYQNETHGNLQSNGCNGNGRYLDPNSINCATYLICTQLNNGSYSSTIVTCPSGTIFSENVKRCVSSTNYTCPGYNSEIAENQCQSNGLFAVPNSSNCSSYLICTQLDDGSYASNRVSCPHGTIFSYNVSRCVSSSSYICPHNKNSTHENIQSSGCRSNGRFPDPTSTNCTSYQICTQLDDKRFSSSPVMCPSGAVFSPIVRRCVSNTSYTCPTTQTETHENLQIVGCQGNGRFADPNSSNCSSFLICTKLEDGSYTSNRVTCPQNTIFSPIVNRCVVLSNYTCNSCSTKGLFPDPNSDDYSSYISCSEDRIPTILKCPQYTLFSSEKRECIIVGDVTFLAEA